MSKREPRSVFQTWAPVYRDLGLHPRRIKTGTKACLDRGWQDAGSSAEKIELWIRRDTDSGIGLLMGSPLPDGTFLGALDVDQDDYVGLAKELLRDPPCGRIGQKGAAFFIRLSRPQPTTSFTIKATSEGKVVDCLFGRSLCVIPPTVHPKTNKPYRWIGTPLHEIELHNLPLVEF